MAALAAASPGDARSVVARLKRSAERIDETVGKIGPMLHEAEQKRRETLRHRPYAGGH